jgi:hypothetical protein
VRAIQALLLDVVEGAVTTPEGVFVPTNPPLQ